MQKEFNGAKGGLLWSRRGDWGEGEFKDSSIESLLQKRLTFRAWWGEVIGGMSVSLQYYEAE